MNKSAYNRKFNSLIKQLDSSLTPEFKSDCVVIFGVSGHDGCQGYTYYFEDTEVQIVRCDEPSSYRSQVGIHLSEVTEASVLDAIETALKDNFRSIYIHSIANKTA